MKILHISPNSPYNENWSYQENILPKYHKKMGHDVTVIITNTMHRDGKIVPTECGSYTSSDGVKIIRMKIKEYKIPILTMLHSKLNIYELLCEIQPDFIFFHGLISSTITDVVKYKKKNNPSCVVVQDNHLDYIIGYENLKPWKKWLLRTYYRRMNRKSQPYVEKVYGVTPWRKLYAEDFFEIPKDKTDILIMGADDEKISFDQKSVIREKIRKKYDISDKDFLIVTGGKIEENKNIHLLMQSCKNMQGVKLLIFGSVDSDMKNEFERLLKNASNIIYIGWIEAVKAYDYFFAADLVMFPGRHSVLWEQACASKVPCIFKKWTGMDHVDIGGNSDYIENVTVAAIQKKIEEVRFTNKYYEMKKIAESDKTNAFLYSKIAEKSLECAGTGREG